MDKPILITRAKDRLRKRVAQLVAGKVTGAVQLNPLFDYLKQKKIHAYFFGGMLRNFSLNTSFEAPRDIDIVVETGLNDLANYFAHNLVRRNSFGGLKLKFGNHDIDLWQLDKTWAFAQRLIVPATANRLPRTTFLDLDALVIEVFPWKGRGRKLYEHGFFNAVASRTVEINLESNPYPELCVVRALAIATSTGFSVGPRLSLYMLHQLQSIKPELFELIQRKHYGKIKSSQEYLLRVRQLLNRQWDATPDRNVNFLSRQTMFVESTDEPPNPTMVKAPDLESIQDHQWGNTGVKSSASTPSMLERFVSYILTNGASAFSGY